MTCAELNLVLPDRVEQRRRIIGNVLVKYSITKSELLGRGREKRITLARREAIMGLDKAGFTPSRIAEILRRERTTIVHCLSEPMLTRKRGTHRLYKILNSLDPSVQAVVRQTAKAESVSIYAVLREWLTERAQYELEAKNRDNRRGGEQVALRGDNLRERERDSNSGDMGLE